MENSSKAIKIKKLKLNNFTKFTDFEVVFNDTVTHLVGMNGSGKTTIGLTAIWACLRGIAEKNKEGCLIGERFRFISPNKKSADIELTLVDTVKNVEIKIKNHITKDGNNISFEAPPTYQVNQYWLTNLLSVSFLSAKYFTQLSSAEQSILLGINTSSFDSRIKSVKDEYTILNREFKGFGELTAPEQAERVQITELMKEKGDVDKFNFDQSTVEQTLKSAQTKVHDLEAEEIELVKKLGELQERIAKGKRYIQDLPKPQPKKDASQIMEKINNAEAINAKAEAYAQYVEKKKKRDAKEAEMQKNREALVAIEKERLDYIKTFDFPFDELTVDESGGLLLKERPIKEPYFSKGELEVIVANLYAAQNPELKLRFIDDFDVLDEKNQEKLVKDLVEQGFQIITAEVNETPRKDGENTVLLRECKVVGKAKREANE